MAKDERTPGEISGRAKGGRPKQFDWVLSVAFPAELRRAIVEEAEREEVAFAEIVRILVQAGLKAMHAEQDEFEVVS